ncbi:MAG TPA: R3H domain-containing nucleic acid-binding protein [Myxococcota bacterium]|nr:R3H domain-containing nucleic acid-binding protein [Myxococcota bacterium]
MYDPKSEAREFIAATRAEAVARACQAFGREESELAIADLGGAVSGSGGRVVIVAQPEGARARSRERVEERGERPERGRGERSERGERGGRGRGGRDRGGRDRDRGERDRGHRDRGDRGGRERGGEPRRDEREQPPIAAALPFESDEPSVGTIEGSLQPIGEFVHGVVERLDLGPFRIKETEEADYLVYQLEGPAAARLAGGEGRTADALQLVANQAALRISEDHKRVVLDVEGDRGRREDFLARIADRAAKRAIESGRSVALEPMNARDRRSIHVALRGAAGVATMSMGSGPYRQVVVVPEGAPEYAEARRLADQAASSEE